MHSKGVWGREKKDIFECVKKLCRVKITLSKVKIFMTAAKKYFKLMTVKGRFP